MSQVTAKGGSGSGASSFVTTSGTAVPLAGEIDIIGAGGITTSASGHTVTITGGTVAATTFTEDSGTATPAANNLNIVGSGGISTSGSGSTVTITASGIINWAVETTTSRTLTANQGVFANNASLVTCTLPTSCAVGDVIKVVAMGAGLVEIGQPAGKQIFFNTSSTTVGVGGYMTALLQNSAVTLVCNVANTSWIAIDSMGSWTIV